MTGEPRPRRVRIELENGHSFSEPIVQARTVLGRADPADVIISESGVSREHTALHVSDAGVELEDLGSTNGTRLNGQRVTGRQLLRDGDAIGIGRATVIFQDGADQTIHFCARSDLREHDTVIRRSVEAELDRLEDGDGGVHWSLDTVRFSGNEASDIARNNRVLAALYRIGRALDPDVSAAILCERVVALAAEALAGERAMVMLAEGDEPARPKAVLNTLGGTFEVNPAITERTLADGVSVLTVALDRGTKELRSILCVPLRLRAARRKRSVQGLLYVDARPASRRYAARDLDLLSILAGQTSAVLDNARLVEELLQARKALTLENQELRKDVSGRYCFDDLIAESPAFAAVLKRLRRVADGDATLLITGDSGTGKELAAKSIHFNSARHKALFVAINCAAIPDNLLEAELFGIERGVATGVAARPGKFEAAGRGTVFLDEIGEMPLSVQAKLLRVLEEREVERLGSHTAVPIDARLVAATNRDLEAEVAAGRFREDLFYRLNVVPIRLPTLRERRADIMPLASFFLRGFCRTSGCEISGFSAGATELLLSHTWPGNIRELQNEIERLVATWDPEEDGSGPVAGSHLSARVQGHSGAESSEVAELESGTIKDVVGALVERAETKMIRSALDKTGGNRVRASTLLGITRESLRQKMNRYGLS